MGRLKNKKPLEALSLKTIIIENHPTVIFHNSHHYRHYMSYQSNKINENDSKQQHPLYDHPDVPELTDLQNMITQSILDNGEPCPFDKIYEYVNMRWKDIRRRDGTPYTTDCRRAIQANLRKNPNHISLFKKDKISGNWKICKTMEEAMEPMKERQRERENKNKFRKRKIEV